MFIVSKRSLDEVILAPIVKIDLAFVISSQFSL